MVFRMTRNLRLRSYSFIAVIITTLNSFAAPEDNFVMLTRVTAKNGADFRTFQCGHGFFRA